MSNSVSIRRINQVLKMNLNIPSYQRPYKWSRKNVSELLNDICDAILDSKRPDFADFKYRVGTIILHKENVDGKEVFNIVDGQQRLITLSLIQYVLSDGYKNSILSHKFSDNDSIWHIFDNYQFICEWVSVNEDKLEEFKNAFKNILEAVVLEVGEISEAFQLFDSQNTRGKELDPHDLLKAYHLREMEDLPFEKLQLIKRWEEIPPKKIREIFSLYLYPILNWAHRQKSKNFTSKDIDSYKGVDKSYSYTYAQRVRKAMPYFQIDQPFCAGSEFFMMVEHYIQLLADLKNEISTNESFSKIREIISPYMRSKEKEKFIYTGFGYAVNLFYCAVLFYYDRFHMLDEMSIKKIFVWAMMLRVDMNNLGFDSINNYAIGDENESYTNHIPMFFLIATSRSNSEIANLRLQVVRKIDNAKSSTWDGLYNELKNLMGVKL